MERTIIITLLLLTTLNLPTTLAQNQYVTLNRLIEKYHFQKVHRFLKMHSFWEEGSGQAMQVIQILKRKLHDNYAEHLYRIEFYENLRYKNAYYLKVLREGRKIVYAGLKEINGQDEKKWKAPEVYETYLKAHELVFGHAVDDKHILFIPYEPIMVGFNCGYAGMAEPPAKDLLKLIQAKKIDEIRQWAYSSNLEIRCYGAIGLTILKTGGETLLESDQQVIQLGLNNEAKINMCQGSVLEGFQATFAEMYGQGVSYFERRIFKGKARKN